MLLAPVVRAGGAHTRQDTCDGDSGGPLVLKRRPGKRDILVGITSYGPYNIRCGAVNGRNIGVRRGAGGGYQGGGPPPALGAQGRFGISGCSNMPVDV